MTVSSPLSLYAGELAIKMSGCTSKSKQSAGAISCDVGDAADKLRNYPELIVQFEGTPR